MTLLQIIVLAIVQGVTEFLPISSSAHLVLIPPLTGWPDQGQTIDVSVHVGTLGAVLVYFHRDVAIIAGGLWRGLAGRPDEATRLAVALLAGTVPIVIAGGAIVALGLESALRDPRLIAWASIGFGLVLYGVDRFSKMARTLGTMTLGPALLVGCAQLLALVPGTSRSGITMTAARALGFSRPEAARFSMLLAIPTIAAAGALTAFELYETGDLALGLDAALSALLAFAAAMAAIAGLLAWLRRSGMTPFVVYRVAAGAFILIWLA